MVRVVWGTFCLNQLNHWSQCRLFIVIMWVMQPWWLPVSLSKEWLMDLGVTWLSWGEKSGQPRPKREAVPVCGQPLANAASFLEALTLQGLPAKPAPDTLAGSWISIFAPCPLVPQIVDITVSGEQSLCLSRAAMEYLWKAVLSVNHDVIWKSPVLAMSFMMSPLKSLGSDSQLFLWGELFLLIDSKMGKRFWGYFTFTSKYLWLVSL